MQDTTAATSIDALPQAMPKPTLIYRYRFPIPVTTAVGAAIADRSVEFIPITGVPGFTHRVVIDDMPRDWLGYGKPSAHAAEYFLRKHWTLA